MGHLLALHSIGDMHDLGRGCPKDHAEAARYFKLAADQGFSQAQYNIAKCYENGEGMVQDSAKAAHYYSLAADQGLATAQIDYGNCFQMGGMGVPQEFFQFCSLLQPRC